MIRSISLNTNMYTTEVESRLQIFDNDGLQDVYFTGNMVENKMYLNEGSFQFKDITKSAGVDGHGRWNSGVAVIDINNDGWQDLYICATTYNPVARRLNLLYVNQGIGDDKQLTSRN